MAENKAPPIMGEVTPATAVMVAQALGTRRKASSRRKKRTTKKKATRRKTTRRAATKKRSTRKKGRLKKGSAEAKRRMAALRRMQKRR